MENKRKRKGQAEEPDHGSPLPFNRIPENGTASSYRDARTKLVQSQFEAPLYSIDRLFTEKELALNMNRAHVATTDFFARLRAQEAESRNAAASTTGVAGNGTDYLNGAKPAATNGFQNAIDNADADSDVPAPNASPSLAHLMPVAPAYHATRSAQRANPLTGFAFGTPVLPPYAINISTNASKANPAAPSPPGLPEAEAQNDLLLMQRGMADPIYEFLVERCCEKQGPMTEVGWWKGALDGDGAGDTTAGPGSIDTTHGQGPSAAAFAMARPASNIGMSSVPMAKSSSMGGASEYGNASTIVSRNRGRLV